jgi:hypothetical protein
MKESESLLAELKQRREKILLKLREVAPEASVELTDLNVAISGLERGSPAEKGDYSGFHKPSGAIFSYLNNVPNPQSPEEIAKAIVKGGYTGETGDPYWILIRSIGYQVDKKRLVKRNNLIGKPEWPKELFVSS